MRAARRRYAAACVAMLLAGCAAFPKNAHLSQYEPHAGYRFTNIDAAEPNSDDLFVVVAFSGGGTRAAALAYGALEELAGTEVEWQGRRKRLIDEIDVISSVSGGSFTAAYYALHGQSLFDGTFERTFLKRDTENALAWQLASPANLIRLASPSYGRSDLAAAYYDREVFAGATYGDLLARRQRPFVMINATDMTLGAQFPFTQDQFDLVCSDLSTLPVARAVAASSAFPGLLTPLTFANYGGTCAYKEPEWIEAAVENDRRVNPERTERADQQRSYYTGRARPYVHLLDGGVADNIGLRSTIYAMSSTDPEWSILRLINQHKIKKLLVIVVNAATDPETDRDQTAHVPALFDVVLDSATVPLDNYSFDTVQLVEASAGNITSGPRMRKSCARLLDQTCPGATLPGGDLAQVDVYVAQVAFDFIADRTERELFRNLPTNFNLPAATVDRLKDVARRLLRQDPQFRQLLDDLR